MSMRFYVVIFDSDGDPRAGVKVTADFGVMNGQASDYSDDNGLATIDTAGDYVTAEIFVDGASEGDYGVSDGETIKINT
ncbi:MAG: hypothetical protein A2081_02955 [Elusimicrobia bacterium GWC2_61_19]|nr:MAG: hypothetical protein A2081_02955 [Elusimicrobia bacterium GWC2_61_19]